MKVTPASPTYSNFSNTFRKHWSHKQTKKKQEHSQSPTDREVEKTNTAQPELSTSKHLWYA